MLVVAVVLTEGAESAIEVVYVAVRLVPVKVVPVPVSATVNIFAANAAVLVAAVKVKDAEPESIWLDVLPVNLAVAADTVAAPEIVEVKVVPTIVTALPEDKARTTAVPLDTSAEDVPRMFEVAPDITAAFVAAVMRTKEEPPVSCDVNVPSTVTVAAVTEALVELVTANESEVMVIAFPVERV